MGSASQPDSPSVKIAVAVHELDRAYAQLDAANRQELIRLVRAWLVTVEAVE